MKLVSPDVVEICSSLWLYCIILKLCDHHYWKIQKKWKIYQQSTKYLHLLVKWLYTVWTSTYDIFTWCSRLCNSAKWWWHVARGGHFRSTNQPFKFTKELVWIGCGPCNYTGTKDGQRCPLTLWPGALHLDPTGGCPPDSHYRLV